MNGRPAHVLVIGAGLAGAATAAALARRGTAVTLLSDPGGRAASAVPLAVMAPYPTRARDPLSRFRNQGLCLTRAWLAHLEAMGLDSGRRVDGVLIVPVRPRERARRDRVRARLGGPRVLDVDQALGASGMRPPEPSVFHPQGACIAPESLASALLAAARPGTVERIAGRVERVVRAGHGWRALDERGRPLATAAQAVLAAGPASASLWPALARALVPVRGQASAFPASAASVGLRLAVSCGGFVTPAFNGLHWVGATAQRYEDDLLARAEDDRENAARFCSLWPGAPAPVPCERFVAVRATTPDRLPIVGELDDGLWVNAGHGSHALQTAALAARLLAGVITGRASHPLWSVVHPARRAVCARDRAANRQVQGRADCPLASTGRRRG